MLRFLIPCAAVLLSGCAFGGGQPKLGGPGAAVQVMASSELPAPTAGDVVGGRREYDLGPLDKLSISAFGIEDLSVEDVQADVNGRISFPLAGVIEAVGKTPSEVEELIEVKLRQRYIRNPQVTVNVKETVSQIVTVDGEVKKPGLYPVVGRMTLMRAVASAQGTAEFAKLDDVVVFRTVGGQDMAALYNLKAIRNGMYKDPELYANDIVIVGDSPQRRLFKDLLQIVPLVTTPLVVALQK